MGATEVGLYSSSKADPSQTLSVPTVKMKFSEYLNLIETKATDLRLFLFPIFKFKPELLKDFGYSSITKGYIKLPFMFFGPKNSVTRMHQDIDMSNVFLTQFEGKNVLYYSHPISRIYYINFHLMSSSGQFVTLELIRSKAKYIKHFNIIKLRSGSCNYLLICIFNIFLSFFYPPNPRHPRSLLFPIAQGLKQDGSILQD